MKRKPRILLVNPWIVDFAAYDLWSKPLGLLTLAAMAQRGGCQVDFIDCLNRKDSHTQARKDILKATQGRFGTGKYPKAPIPTPKVFSDLPRTYFRYGIHPQSFQKRLTSLAKPDLILVGSSMTYWYPGVLCVLQFLSQYFPEVPRWLGGLYARLCPDHAGQLDLDTEVVLAAPQTLRRKIEERLNWTMSNPNEWDDFRDWPAPAWDLVEGLEYLPLLTSLGCLKKCPYCAASFLQPKFVRKAEEPILKEIVEWHHRGLKDFVFYDDALLLHAEETLGVVFDKIIQMNIPIRFHTPNALHVNALSHEWCQRLAQGNMATIRLGLETTDKSRQKHWGGKTDLKHFVKVVAQLEHAGINIQQNVGAYLLCGALGQTPKEVETAIRFVSQETGVAPFLAEFSPIPHTPMWEEAVRISKYDLVFEPLTHNNTLFACRRPEFSYNAMLELKNQAREARQFLRKQDSNH